jgi:hypothetical protein
MKQLFINYLQDYVSSPFIYKLLIVAIAWLCIAVAIAIDRKSGIQKAKERGEDISSHGLRRTITKGVQYYGFMVFGFIFDCFIMLILSSFSVPDILILPYATITVAIVCVNIEYKSVKENAEAKVRRYLPDFLEILKNPEARSIVSNIIQQIDKSEHDETDGNE